MLTADQKTDVREAICKNETNAKLTVFLSLMVHKIPEEVAGKVLDNFQAAYDSLFAAIGDTRSGETVQ